MADTIIVKMIEAFGHLEENESIRVYPYDLIQDDFYINQKGEDKFIKVIDDLDGVYYITKELAEEYSDKVL